MQAPVTFSETEIPGVLLVETRYFGDARGYFTEVHSEPAWKAAGFAEHFVQDNLSLSRNGTLRGMHYQLAPHGMGKFVRVLRGAVFDVAVDLRRGSPTFSRWLGQVLSEENRLGLWIPKGLAHGFLALDDDTLMYYKCNAVYTPAAERSLRYDDPAVGIDWPAKPVHVSPRDAQAPLLEAAEYNFVYPG
jgi:dTDP-4-dehydrorhamnose 3,5-epimerase